jgi:predicted O-methyltransferase YrrM
VSDKDKWVEVDTYIDGLFVNPDPVLEAALAASEAAGLPAIEVAPSHGKLLMLLATIRGARRILEIGTLGGYSTIWLARALPADGRLISLEASAKHADVARANIEAAGLSGVTEVRVGQALDTLPKLEEEGAGPFDFVFIDADKSNNVAYFRWALKLSRPGTAIFVKGTRSLLKLISEEPRVSATVIQTVSVKGHDGFALAVVKDEA